MTEKSELYQLFDPTLRKLSNDELAELEALIKNFQLPRYTVRELKARAGKNLPTPEEDYLTELKRLRDYNLKLRELGEEDAGRTPASEEEARELGYLLATEIIQALPGEFADHNKLTRLLDKHPEVKMYKPTGNKKMIHAADLLRTLYNRNSDIDEQIDEYTAGKKEC